MAKQLTVITRAAGDSMAQCELTCIGREPIDIQRVHQQHRAYVQLFKHKRDIDGHRVNLIELPPLPAQQDAMFVEDVAVMCDDCAVITRPGAASRRAEVDAIVDAVAAVRPEFLRIAEPGTVEGGDVLCIGKFVIIGKSTRSNDEGFAQVKAFLEPRGYRVLQCPITKCLHLKSAVSKLCEDTVLLNPDWVSGDFFRTLGLNVVHVDAAEPDSANVLTFVTWPADAPAVGGSGGSREPERTIVVAAAFPKLAAMLQAIAATGAIAERESLSRVTVTVIEADEVAKAEGALTCCSLLAYGN